MIGSLCEAYHWTVEEAFKLTTPQIILLCHYSSESAKRFKSKTSGGEYDYSRSSQSNRLVDNKDYNPKIYGGKTLNEMKDGDWETNGMLNYLGILTNLDAM